MIASTDRDGRVTVTGTVREWLLFLERLDARRLEQPDESANAREILIVASAVPLNGEGGNGASEFRSTSNGSK